MNDIENLAEVLISRFSHVTIREDYGWPQNPALSVLDCVLSLRNKYDGFCLPRVQNFALKWPGVVQLSQLAEMMAEYEKPGAFFLAEFNYNYAGREHTLRGVVNVLSLTQAKNPGSSEWERLQSWALSAQPRDYLSFGVRGFGPAGFQYMRMLLGAQTTKPDVHIKRFVSQIVGRSVDELQALELLEKASLLANLPLREVDGEIWGAGARGSFVT
jgi:hypothetical protein